MLMIKALNRKLLFIKSEKGSAMIIAIGAVGILTILGMGMVQLTSNEFQAIVKEKSSTNAYYFAEAAVEKTMKELNTNPGYTGTTSPVAFGGGEYEVIVNTSSDGKKVISATGYYPSKADPVSTKTIRTQLISGGTNLPFSFAAQGGNGGINIQGNVRVNGSLASNQNITVGTNARVNGSAWAYGTISGGTRITPGPVLQNQRPALIMPSFDLNPFMTAAESGGTLSSFTLSGGSQSLGPKRITGNLTVTGGTLTITGPVWVNGNIALSGNSVTQLSSTWGTVGTLVVAGGTNSTITSGGNAALRGASTGGCIMFVSLRNSATQYGISATGNNATFLNIAMYCPNAGIQLSGNGHAVALLANRLYMAGNGIIDYRSDLANLRFATAPGAGYGIQGGSWRVFP